MKLQKLIVILLFLLTNITAIGQSLESSKEIRKLRPTGLTANLGGPSILVGGSITRYISPSFDGSFSFGVGYFTQSFSAGTKYHFLGNNRWSPNIGSHFMVYDDQDIFDESNKTMYAIYVPIALEYFGPGGFTFGVELGPMIPLGDSEFHTKNWGGLTIGHRF